MDRGSATRDLQYAYFIPWDSHFVYRYEWSTEKWDKLPPCLYYNSTLVVIDGALTAVGGYDDKYRYTNKLVTLRQGQWVEELPPMKTARSLTAVVSTSDGEYILVIGGCSGVQWTTTVELFQVMSRIWFEVSDLPQPLTWPSATICGNPIQCHVIGRDGNGFSYSLQDLPSDKFFTLSWSPLPPLPVTLSTAATLCGQLVIIGGAQDGVPINSIRQLVDGQWVGIGSMSSGRWRCLVVSPSPDKMMIVGGRRRGLGARGSVEECVVVQ